MPFKDISPSNKESKASQSLPKTKVNLSQLFVEANGLKIAAEEHAAILMDIQNNQQGIYLSKNLSDSEGIELHRYLQERLKKEYRVKLNPNKQLEKLADLVQTKYILNKENEERREYSEYSEDSEAFILQP